MQYLLIICQSSSSKTFSNYHPNIWSRNRNLLETCTKERHNMLLFGDAKWSIIC